VTVNERREMGDADACRIPDDRLPVMIPSSRLSDQSRTMSAISPMRRLRVPWSSWMACPAPDSPYGVVTR